jgi:hypothetical protein
MVSSNKDYVCLSTQQSSYIYHITPELQFKPFLRMDTRVRVFDAQADRAICDENVLRMSQNQCSEIIQTLPTDSEPLSMLTVGNDILLIGLPTYLNLAQYKFKDGQYQKFLKCPVKAVGTVYAKHGITSLKKYGSSTECVFVQVNDKSLLKT